MSHAMTFSRTVSTTEGQITSSVTATGEMKVVCQVTVPAETTDFELDIALDVSTILGIAIHSTKDLTVETNSSSAPDETLALKANKAYEWETNDYNTLLLETDITALYLTNAGDEDAVFKVRAITDPTPA